jgi:hypothetical protein
MAVSKKGMRKVNYKGRQYLWYVNDAESWVPDQGFVEAGKVRVLHIISSNKQFMPRWKYDSKAYPTADFVRRLIDWCMADKADE